MLPSSEIIIAALDKIFLALQDTVQIESVKSKWEEIKKLQISSLEKPSINMFY